MAADCAQVKSSIVSGQATAAMPGSATVSAGEGSGTRVQSSQLFAANVRWKIVLSVPRAKTSRRPGPQDATAGPKFSTPPSNSQSLHSLSVNHLCQSARSVPRTKTSILPSPHDTAAGGEFSTPPSELPVAPDPVLQIRGIFVPEREVLAAGEDVEPVRPPRAHRRRRGQPAAERPPSRNLPACGWRHGRERGGARGQLQKSTARKLHGDLLSLSETEVARHRCADDARRSLEPNNVRRLGNEISEGW